MPGHSHTGGSHTLWGSLMCDRPGIYVGTTYNIVFWTAHYIVVYCEHFIKIFYFKKFGKTFYHLKHVATPPLF